MNVDLIIENIDQLVTCASGGKPKRGPEMNDIGIVENGAIAIKEGKFVGVGDRKEISGEFTSSNVIDARGRVVCPGFVDPHTHIVYGGNRLDEFELKIKGANYLAILEAGGGIISTVRQTREAGFEELVSQSRKRLDKMLACGTTTCEIKTGYGLNAETELKMLAVIEELEKTHTVDIVPTFLAAHTVPPEHKSNPNVYVAVICDTMLSSAWKWFVASDFRGRVPFFCDVFCENKAFDLEQSRRILETARSLGFGLKAHVGQFTNLGGAKMAIEAGAVSVDHLDYITDDEIQMLGVSNTIGVVTPAMNFNSGSSLFANARKLVDADCAVALSTDYNPGSAPCPSQQMAMAIACRYQELSPAEALNAATINAAFSVGLGNTFGSIEIEKAADFVVYNFEDHRELAYEFGSSKVEKVFKKGELVYSAN
jgi:imidazolonepropionase